MLLQKIQIERGLRQEKVDILDTSIVITKLGINRHEFAYGESAHFLDKTSKIRV